MHPRISPADVLTLGNGMCGFVAIAIAGGLTLTTTGAYPRLRDHQLRECLLLYGIGMACDVLDGPIARWRGSSGLGSALDTVSDTITFGILPAILLLARYQDHRGWRLPVLVAACAYVATTVLRLARHSRVESAEREAAARRGRDPERAAFSGLPSPAGGNCVLAVVVLAPAVAIAVSVVAVVAVLLVADFPYPDNSAAGGVFVGGLLAASFAAIAGLISLDIPSVIALVGLLPIAIYRAVAEGFRGA